jgi:hypothetical protein
MLVEEVISLTLQHDIWVIWVLLGSVVLLFLDFFAVYRGICERVDESEEVEAFDDIIVEGVFLQGVVHLVQGAGLGVQF